MKGPFPSTFAVSLLALAFTLSPLLAQIEEHEEYRAAILALQDNLPSVAADKLQRLLADPSLEFGESDTTQLKLKLIESQARAGRAEQTLTLCAAANLKGTPTMHFWKAVALTDLGLYHEAEQELAALETEPTCPLFANACLSRASILELLDDPEAALEALGPLLANPATPTDRARAMLKAASLYLNVGKGTETEIILNNDPLKDPALDHEVRYLRGKLALSRNLYPKAAEIFRSLVEETRDSDRRTFVEATIGLADALAGESKVDEAVDLLVRYINEAPNGASLGEAFQRLEYLGYFRRPRVQAVLDSWATSSNPDLRAFTLYFGARKDPDKAIANLELFRKEHYKHFLFPAAMLKLADLYLDSGKREEAKEVLVLVSNRTANPEVQHYVAHLAGRAEFANQEFGKAIEDFQQSATEEDPTALFNEAVAALYASRPEAFARAVSMLKLQRNADQIQADLLLERGLYLAANSQPGATSALKDFAKAYPDHPRAVEAEIALAELYLLEFPPKLNSAREQLTKAKTRQISDEFAEKIDYTAVWIETAAGDFHASIEAAQHYLDTWKDSPRYAEMEMKLGEIYFAQKDYANAQNHFELVARHDSNGPNSETALFFAGMAASLTMNEQGIKLWGQVVDRKGPLAEEARRQQGLTKLKQDQPDDAIAVFERVLSSKKLDPKVRMATLMNMGQALLRKADGNSDPTAMLIQAIGVYDEILESKEAPRYWRNQAAVHKARCLERTLDFESALEVYYTVVSKPPEVGLSRNETAEYTWYYRAGFSAINLLRRREQWGAAIKLAERLSQTSGPRAQEAGEIASQLRLEHFIPWDAPLE